MPAQTSMLHVRVDDQLKAQATDALGAIPDGTEAFTITTNGGYSWICVAKLHY